MSTKTFERRVEFRPSYDKRSSIPSKNYGIHNMEISFILIGTKGAVTWGIYTGWYVKTARDHLDGLPQRTRSILYEPGRPNGFDLGFHAREPQWEGHSVACENCCYTEGPCYYDGSGLNAELPIEGFLEKGTEEYLWPKLEAYYHNVFEEGPWPFEVEAAIAKERGRYV